MDELIEYIVLALREITVSRYFNTERGFVAEFYCQLRNQLKETTIFPADTILESEVQKRVSQHFGMRQRPDIILHIPVETGYTENTNQNNFVVFAFKLHADPDDMKDDFMKLDEMIDILNYHYGVFINIGSYPEISLSNYKGPFPDRILDFSIRLNNNKVEIKHSFWDNGKIVTVEK